MAVTAYDSGTQSCTIGTEHFLSSPNVAGVFTLHLDASNLDAGDLLEVRIYQKILTGGTERVVFYAIFAGAQTVEDAIKVSVPIANDLAESDALRFSVKQTAGTGRDVAWKVLTY
jgi:hypothetical protein